jgi:uncharacterized protein RhaS with RHS repeats
VGRYLTKDPIDIETGETNFYLYSLNNPTDFMDSYGLITMMCKRQSFVKDKDKKKRKYNDFTAHCYFIANGTVFSWHTENQGGVTSDEYPEYNDCRTVSCPTKDCKDHNKELENCVYKKGLELKKDPGWVWIPKTPWDCCGRTRDLIQSCQLGLGCSTLVDW